jgi:hypothetical protein
MDVRNEARWGIGAEISLAAAKPLVVKFMGVLSIGFGTLVVPGLAEVFCHPFTKSSPQSISSLHFYPAMFGLWVYITQEESKMTNCGEDFVNGWLRIRRS